MMLMTLEVVVAPRLSVATTVRSSKQLLEEAQRKSAESAVSKTTKQIYMDLVRNFHPDTEMDEERKIWKTEIMQQITAAYEEDDYIRLLELQMSLLDERENAVSSFDEKQLSPRQVQSAISASKNKGEDYELFASRIEYADEKRAVEAGVGSASFRLQKNQESLDSFITACKINGRDVKAFRISIGELRSRKDLVWQGRFENGINECQ